MQPSLLHHCRARAIFLLPRMNACLPHGREGHQECLFCANSARGLQRAGVDEGIKKACRGYLRALARHECLEEPASFALTDKGPARLAEIRLMSLEFSIEALAHSRPSNSCRDVSLGVPKDSLQAIHAAENQQKVPACEHEMRKRWNPMQSTNSSVDISLFLFNGEVGRVTDKMMKEGGESGHTCSLRIAKSWRHPPAAHPAPMSPPSSHRDPRSFRLGRGRKRFRAGMGRHAPDTPSTGLNPPKHTRELSPPLAAIAQQLVQRNGTNWEFGCHRKRKQLRGRNGLDYGFAFFTGASRRLLRADSFASEDGIALRCRQ